ncbi:hypothetical protein EB796_019869 [Bugula neritina]|uniref:Uncharacterized protein n=1 Tax=Bugula neritina TaxID=10212 RepID=A0A7J7J8X9_BUGNE|nr:hypothetical protein EB796_019869 [Bugula neritina]
MQLSVIVIMFTNSEGYMPIISIYCKGKDGLQGPPGVAGPPGPPGPPGATNEFTAPGAVYTRWARTSCVKESQLLYSGFVGSASFSTQGGGVNYQCMPTDPEYSNYSSKFPSIFASYISGAEFHTHNFGIFSDSVHNQNVPCARCYTEYRSAVVMIPAKTTCPVGWTKEYQGK